MAFILECDDSPSRYALTGCMLLMGRRAMRGLYRAIQLFAVDVVLCGSAGAACGRFKSSEISRAIYLPIGANVVIHDCSVAALCVGV